VTMDQNENGLHDDDGNGEFVNVNQLSGTYHEYVYQNEYSSNQESGAIVHDGEACAEHDYYDSANIQNGEYLADNGLLTNNEDGIMNAGTIASGSFYQLAPQYVPHIQSSSISALAIDPKKKRPFMLQGILSLSTEDDLMRRILRQEYHPRADHIPSKE